MKLKNTWLLILLFLLSIAALLPASPILQHTPPRDSGIFLYVGSRMLKGDLLYKNIWDDKPPMIFLINALGLWISAGSLWGVWILEVIGILTAVWMAFSVLKSSFGNTAAVLGIVAGLSILLITLHGGNYTEEYAIPFQFACLFFLVQSERKGGIWPAFASGVALGILFFLRQNLISVGAAIVIYLVARALLSRSWKPIRQGLIMLLGLICFNIVCLSFLAIQGTLAEFWDAAFVFSLAYSNLGLLERIKSVSDTLRFFSQIPLLLLSLPVWFLALYLLLRQGTSTTIKIIKNRWTGWILLAGGIILLGGGIFSDILPGSRSAMGLLQQGAIVFGVIVTGLAILQVSSLLPRYALPRLEKITYHLSSASTTIIAIAVLWYPIEMVMVNLSGRSYLHYYMAMVAICTVLFAFLADQIKKLLGFWRNINPELLLVSGWCIGIILTLIYNPINSLRVMYSTEGDNQTWRAVRYIVANTQQDDKVLIWGAEPVINFLSNRSSPLRYPYLYPFYTINYRVKALSAEVLADIQTKRPVLIIYTEDTPFVNITPDGKCEMPTKPLLAGMKDVMKDICSNYHYVGEIGKAGAGWKIYRINN